jgi:hypothetical protein
VQATYPRRQLSYLNRNAKKNKNRPLIQNDFLASKKWGFGRGAFRQHSSVCLMLLGSFDALPTMPILTKLLPLPDAVLAFLISGQRWNGMASVGGIFKNCAGKISRTLGSGLTT